MKLVNKDSRFIIVPDTHFWDRNLANRRDYQSECEDIFNYLCTLTKESNGKKVYFIFLGDIFHSGFNSDTTYNNWCQKMLMLRSKCNGIFTVVGNHEITYREHNPFWGLVSEIESTYVQDLGLQAKGNLPVIRIVDTIEIFDYSLNFNHYGELINNLSSNTSFLFCHNYWMSDNLYQSLSMIGEKQLNTKYINYNTINDNCDLRFFDEVFLGHNHMLIGDYEFEWDDPNQIYNKTNVHFCGSLGLTNKNEVLYTSDHRNIFYLDISKDNYKVKKHVYNLLKKNKEVLYQQQVDKSEEKYKATKYKKSLIKKYDLKMLDPIEAIRKDLQDDTLALQLFDELERGGVPEWIQRLI